MNVTCLGEIQLLHDSREIQHEIARAKIGF